MSPGKLPIARKRNFFQDGPGVLVICPVVKNCDSKTKKMLKAPNIQIFGSKLHLFVPSLVNVFYSKHHAVERWDLELGSNSTEKFVHCPEVIKVKVLNDDDDADLKNSYHS